MNSVENKSSRGNYLTTILTKKYTGNRSSTPGPIVTQEPFEQMCLPFRSWYRSNRVTLPEPGHQGSELKFSSKCRTTLGIVQYWIIVGRRLHGDGICYANVAFLEPSTSTPLNGFLQEFNTWRASVGNKTLRRDFWVSVPQKLGPQNYLFVLTYLLTFDDFATQWQFWRPISPARNMI